MHCFMRDYNNCVGKSMIRQFIVSNVKGIKRRDMLGFSVFSAIIDNNANEYKYMFNKRRNYYSWLSCSLKFMGGNKKKSKKNVDITHIYARKTVLYLNSNMFFSTNKKLNIINPQKIRNVAIIAHVDHGKTTLVDKLLRQGGEEQINDRVMDHNDLEKERGITIMSKVTRIKYGDYFFNIVDTPGHSDFGGEVERVLNLIDGVCLIIDVVEGPKNQTKFVLKKSLLNPKCKIIVIMNKFDKPSNIKKKEEIENEIFDLFADLNAPDELMNYPILYASAKNGWCTDNFDDAKQNKCEHNNVLVIFKKIIDYFDAPLTSSIVPADHSDDNTKAEVDTQVNSDEINCNINGVINSEGSTCINSCSNDVDEDSKRRSEIMKEPFSLLVSLIDHQEGVGVTVTGKIYSGVIKKGDTIIVKNEENKIRGNCVIKNIFYMKGRKIENVISASAGDIVNISFSKGIIPSVNDTLSSNEKVPSLKARPIDPPVLCLKISQNTSPLTGKDGKHITLSSIGNRLKKEAAINVAIEINESEKKDSYEVKGRGELQLGILIEKLRREGYEMTISSPNVVYTKDEKGNLLEPIEEFHITIPSLMSSNVIEKLNTRKAEIIDIVNDNDNTFIKCICPSRNFFGMRSYLRDISKGTSIINSELKEYKKKQTSFKGDRNGVIISSSNGTTTAFSLDPIQLKGFLFVNENFPTYEGMIIGEHFLSNDIEMNAVKIKPVQHLRNKGHEETIRINHKQITIEYALSFIQDDEEIEVTPKRIVMRKKILNTEMRKTANRKIKNS
ncbi:GTP-binding translation elongation factor tu family protein, putative [Plasmodium malariae]|uniref:GTP-binding translation elongation factor tu family protein, putative n=1 Tax=Plasmodium malariae TaxID=5858 RepID=A0A1C3L2F3_PLAMA|nr:GTP-binding translation elongation factor tu family protein, putative [Plasmodium malariae]